MSKYLNRRSIEVKIGTVGQNDVPIYNEQLKVWDTIDSSIFAKLDQANVFEQDLTVSGSLFIKELNVEDNLIFRQTGSFWSTLNDLQITGSLSIDSQESKDVVEISVLGESKIKVNEEGILVLTPLENAPTPVSGGIYFSTSSEFFLGF